MFIGRTLVLTVLASLALGGCAPPRPSLRARPNLSMPAAGGPMEGYVISVARLYERW